MQGGWQPPPGGGGGGYGPPGGGGYGGPPQGGPGSGYGAPPQGGPPQGGMGAPAGYGAPPPQQGYAPNPYGGAPPGMQGGPGMGGMGMGMSPQYGNYEFNEYENSVIDKAASRMKLWGIISTVIGGLQVVGSCGMFASPSLATYLPAGIVAIVVGVTFLGAGNSLKSVVTTEGNDLAHMMQALQKMSTAFMIEIVCAIVGFVLAVIGLVLVMLFFAVAVAAQ